jgi:uncharacterized DUF497 family protein
MNFEFDQVKRGKTLLERGLDFARVVEVFDGLDTTRRGAPYHQYEESK